jgi:hypothetical protein
MIDQFGAGDAPAGAVRRETWARILARRISTSNPFYVISALLVLVGLRVSFGPESGQPAQPAALAFGLVSYVVLLAVTAGLLARLGNVWEDVRTLLLLVVFFLLTVSTAFDGILASNWKRGAACDLAGWVFAVVVSEVLLRGTRLRLPLLYRLPYHLIVALFFIYPIALGPLLKDPASPALHWALFGFATFAGLAFLTLLPAIRRGPAYIKTASPWRWPMYPWALFFFLSLGVCLRAWYLCETMHHLGFPSARKSIFGPFFLAPFLLALCALLLEIGLVSRIRNTIRVALVAPFGLIALSGVGHQSDVVYQRFLDFFHGALGGTPLFVTVAAVIAFHSVAAWRRVPGARSALLVSLAIFCWIAPDTLSLGQISGPRPWPSAAFGVVLLVLGWRWNEGWRMALGAACVQTALWTGLDWFSPFARELICVHSALALLLGLGVISHGTFGSYCRVAGLTGLAAAGLASTLGIGQGKSGVAIEFVQLYPFFSASLALIYGAAVNARYSGRISASVSLAGSMLSAGRHLYENVRATISGLDQIALGLAFFAVAALISASKAGILRRSLLRCTDWLHHHSNNPVDQT